MKYFVMLFISSLLFISCNDELITNFITPEEAASGVVHKKTYTFDSSQLLAIEDFEYDQGRLAKKSYYSSNRETLFGFEKFYYDERGLTSVVMYNKNINSPTGFITLDSTLYIYSREGLLQSKRVLHPSSDSYEEFKYEYGGGNLKSELYYYKNIFMKKTVYEYNGSVKVSETDYDVADRIISIKRYVYVTGFLKECLSYDSVGQLLTRTSYVYFPNGKLYAETLEVVAPFLSIMSHTVRYEYY